VTFKVDTDDLASISKAFTDAAEDVRTLTGKLTGPPDLSSERDWGAAEAATSYVETRDFWVTSLGQLVTSLDCISRKLSLASAHYSQTEQAATVTSE
jgi:uncharacterized protein YukE